MNFSADWYDQATNAVDEERATLADFRVTVGSENVCRHLDGDGVRDHLTLPLSSIVEGLVHDWWRLFGGRDIEIPLIRYRMGHALPDIRFRFDGACFEIEARQISFVNPPVQFWAGGPEVMGRVEAETQLDRFIEGTLARLVDQGVVGTAAALRWARVTESRADPEEAAFCEAGGALGLDPYSIDEAVAAEIEAAAGVFEGEALTEFLAGLRDVKVKQAVDWVAQVKQRQARYRSRLPDLGSIAGMSVQTPRPGERAWTLGYRCARSVRKTMDLDQTRRFSSYGDLAKALGGPGFESAGKVEGVRAVREQQLDGIHIHLRSHGSTSEARSSALFAFARAVGDVVCMPDREMSPINDLHNSFRQAANRAFAAEFLAPSAEIQSMREDGYDLTSIAAEFCVDERVIERQYENADRIAQALV